MFKLRWNIFARKHGTISLINHLYSSSPSSSSTFNGGSNRYSRIKNGAKFLIPMVGGVGVYMYINGIKKAEARNDIKSIHDQEVKGLPFYSLKMVSQHNSKDKRVWVTFKSGVYDITDFVDKHPGGDKITMAYGGSLEPFWELYAVHKSDQILRILEDYRIGNLSKEDREIANKSTDPYASDPIRHPSLVPRSLKPYNAESPLAILAENFFVPNELFFVRNHLPVPEVDLNDFIVEVEGFGINKSVNLTLEDIKSKFPKHTISATIQCTGNRRSEMNKVKEVKGLPWGAAAIGNAKWSGARLVDVLEYCKLNFSDDRIQHVQFEGLDLDTSAVPYGASIPSDYALDPKNDLILAYEMNDKELPRDHGFPLRLVAPGITGARNVKWLTKIVVSEHESESHWQKRDYKSFSPSVDWNNVDFDSAPAIQDTPVQSAICQPLDGEKVQIKDKHIHLQGYAFSGSGNKIIRVDVSCDGGKTWSTGELQQDPTPLSRTWSWTLWKASIPVTETMLKEKEVTLICKAVDSTYNVQPESFAPIWNLRGVLSNAWSRVKVKIT